MNARVPSRYPPIETPWDHSEVERLVNKAIAEGRTKIRRSSMRIGSYNGFPRETRLEADRKIKIAQELGLIPAPTKCSVCESQNGTMHYHAEDYSKPLQIAPICQRCHMALHNRDRSPSYAMRWQALVNEHGDGSKWFEHLTGSNDDDGIRSGLTAPPREERKVKICPSPRAWDRVYQKLLLHARLSRLPSEPPVPLILAGWAFSTDLEKKMRWQETVAWAAKNGCAEAVNNLSREDWLEKS